MKASILRIGAVIAIIAITLPTSADANAPAGQYVVAAGGNVNGTVYDTKTKLTWQQTALSTKYTWASAKTYCAGVGTSLGGTGWRLPTIKELMTIVDYSQATGPMIDPNAFPGTPSAIFWSSSPSIESSTHAVVVNFSNGYIVEYVFSTLLAVRCVR
jgi:hypothetical protein